MTQEPLKPEDLRLLDRLLQLQPELRETIYLVKQITAKAKFPIQSLDDLIEALGGEEVTITFRGRTMTMGQVRNLIPAYYFPIGSERDLIAKISDLTKGRFPVQPIERPGLEAAIRLMPPTGTRPEGVPVPEIAMEEVLRISEFGRHAPGLGGLQRRP